ncbi:hypothetical protein CDAR_37751 [Caerostris darwini]|uniref:Uncharacterized protein n=1 Tax=Caerostris darwini TaxID=1538125 RepID=A0AAV4RER7_9ARAC|nr:hypothetical protein CDAR_37751 [Caerostris darwini]
MANSILMRVTWARKSCDKWMSVIWDLSPEQNVTGGMSKSCQKPNPLGVCGVMIMIKAPHLMDWKRFAQLMNGWILGTAWKVSIRRDFIFQK